MRARIVRSVVRAVLVAGVAAAATAAGCATAADGTGNTNWLAPCKDSSTCGKYVCLCRVCMNPCEGRLDCSRAPESACVQDDAGGASGVGGAGGAGDAAKGGSPGADAATDAAPDGSSGSSKSLRCDDLEFDDPDAATADCSGGPSRVLTPHASLAGYSTFDAGGSSGVTVVEGSDTFVTMVGVTGPKGTREFALSFDADGHCTAILADETFPPGSTGLHHGIAHAETGGGTTAVLLSTGGRGCFGTCDAQLFINGKQVPVPPRPAQPIPVSTERFAVTPSGLLFYVRSYLGPTTGRQLFLLDRNGTVLRSAEVDPSGFELDEVEAGDDAHLYVLSLASTNLGASRNRIEVFDENLDPAVDWYAPADVGIAAIDAVGPTTLALAGSPAPGDAAPAGGDIWVQLLDVSTQTLLWPAVPKLPPGVALDVAASPGGAIWITGLHQPPGDFFVARVSAVGKVDVPPVFDALASGGRGIHASSDDHVIAVNASGVVYCGSFAPDGGAR